MLPGSFVSGVSGASVAGGSVGEGSVDGGSVAGGVVEGDPLADHLVQMYLWWDFHCLMDP